ncbi:protein SPT2 homolog isoform X2 [Ambystoma mexicanum]|uniref:protein SPT2 homolog isoform X2 n=1 Tax=Ambystoma mexicanum TaxID=8296 RepID=UPI0037E751DF
MRRGPPARSRSPQGASSNSGQSSRISPSPRGGCSSRSPSPRGACSSRSPSPQGACSRSPSPQEACSRSPSPQEACSRSPSPQEACSRSPSPQEACRSHSPQEPCGSPSPQGACRSQSPQEACRSPSPQGACRSPSPQGACRSPSPQGACSSRSPSPQGACSRSCMGPEISDTRNSQISPASVSVNQSNGNVARASTASTRVEEQAIAPSSPSLPVSLYAVKVRYFAKHLKNTDIKSFLTEKFMFYGKVVSVTVNKNGRSRYGLVFYKQSHERDRALKANITGPSGIKPLILPWNGPPPCIFGIKIKNIDNNVSDLPERIQSEFGIFGDIALVQGYGPSEKRFSLVFYRYQEGQQKALASPNPFQTSFGNVFVSPWNKPPKPEKEMPFAIPPSQQGASRRRPFPQRESNSISIGPKISNTSNRQLSPTSVSVNQSNGNVGRVSATPTRAEEQAIAPSSPRLPVSTSKILQPIGTNSSLALKMDY